MEASYQPQNTATKLFEQNTKPSMRRISWRIEPAAYDEIVQISNHEGLELSATIRELISLALRYYKFKKGTLNTENPKNKNTFFCQSCKAETKMRYVCYKTLDFDQYLICEDCMFNKDKLKRFVSAILQGV